jgi:serine/threonine protein kinase/Tol biopolymer transport system component
MVTAGARLGPYEILSPLGAGGMGEVYKARDTRLDRTVALKVLPDHVVTNPDLKQRFEREAKTLAALSHPHICPVFDVGSENGIRFLVMEYLEGETLEQRLKNGALPLDQALQVGMQIADALVAAHRAGVVHRDLKPGNIMLTKSGATLLDFGLAKTAAPAVGSSLSVLPTTPPNLTAQGTILGTVQYMAPEQLEGQEADARTDIFAFGAVLYETVTGKKAFEGKSQASLIAAILEREPLPMSAVQPLVSPALDRVVKKCLVKEAERRWQTARDLADELTWIAELGTMPLVVRSSSRVRMALTAGSLAAVAAAILLASATLYFRGATPESLVTRLDVVTPSTSEPYSFALSPDGRQLVYVANGDKGLQLWLRPLDQAAAQSLAGTEGALYPFWSPDGRSLGFFADAKLKRIDLPGSPPRVLADAPAARGGTWNRDGVIVFSAATNSGLMRLAAAGGTPMAVTHLAEGEVSHRWPQFLPDGRTFLFFVAQGRPETLGVYIASLDGGTPTRLLASDQAALYASPGYLLWVLQEGTLVARRFETANGAFRGDPSPVAYSVGRDNALSRGAFSVSDSGVLALRTGAAFQRQLVWVDRSGNTLGTVGPPEQTALAYPDLAPDGERIAVMRNVDGNTDVWLIEVGRGITSRLTFDPANDSAPVWSPDGTRIVFRSGRQGKYDLFEKAANGVGDEQLLLATDQDKAPLDWSRDGRFLLYSEQNPKTQSDLWVLPLTSDRPSAGSGRAEPAEALKAFPVVQTGFDDVQGQFSPDGRWLAYASNETGSYEVYVRSFPDPDIKRQISIGGGIYPRWRRDGRELFYLTLANRMMAVPIESAPQTRALNSGTPVVLFASRIAIGANVGTGGALSKAQYAVAPDGRRFLLNTTAADNATSPITIVLNWDVALKRLVATK